MSKKYTAPEFATGRVPAQTAGPRRKVGKVGRHNPIPRQFVDRDPSPTRGAVT